MDGSRDVRNQQKPCDEISIKKITSDIADTAEKISVEQLSQRVNELSAMIQKMGQGLGMPKHSMLTPAPSFPLHPANDDDISKPQISRGASLDLRLKPLMVKER